MHGSIWFYTLLQIPTRMCCTLSGLQTEASGVCHLDFRSVGANIGNADGQRSPFDTSRGRWPALLCGSKEGAIWNLDTPECCQERRRKAWKRPILISDQRALPS